MLWTYQYQDGVMDSSAIVHFTAVMGIHRSSLAYRDAYNFTPDLAALIWVGRLLFLEYSRIASRDIVTTRWCIPGLPGTHIHHNRSV